MKINNRDIIESAPQPMKRPAFDASRFSVGKTLNQRQAELKLFCDRMPSLTPQLIASKMAHIKTEELRETYDLIDKNARNFTALWRWHFMPKLEKRD